MSHVNIHYHKWPLHKWLSFMPLTLFLCLLGPNSNDRKFSQHYKYRTTCSKTSSFIPLMNVSLCALTYDDSNYTSLPASVTLHLAFGCNTGDWCSQHLLHCRAGALKWTYTTEWFLQTSLDTAVSYILFRPPDIMAGLIFCCCNLCFTLLLVSHTAERLPKYMSNVSHRSSTKMTDISPTPYLIFTGANKCEIWPHFPPQTYWVARVSKRSSISAMWNKFLEHRWFIYLFPKFGIWYSLVHLVPKKWVYRFDASKAGREISLNL